jgi:TM2 domain-containing membrane protein YozV
MSKALVRTGAANGVVPAVCSAIVPGLGQLVNKETNKAIGVFAVYVVAGASVLGAILLVGPVAGVVAAGTWLYGVFDGYIQGRKK